MKKIAALLIIFLSAPAYANVSEFFDNLDENAVKAGISKYILSRGGTVNHGESYNSNTFQAVEALYTKRGNYKYSYVFNLTPQNNGTNLEMAVLKSGYGVQPSAIDIETEKKIMEGIKATIRGRFLYGLGFEYANYSYDGKTYKAPKGKETGIVLTAVKYDALKKGLMAGDVIIEINGIPIKDIPIEKYTNILNAKSMTDELNLTYLRKGVKYNVTLEPRLSNTRVF